MSQATRKPASLLHKLLRPARRGLSLVLKHLPLSSATLGPPRGIVDSAAAWIRSPANTSSELFRVTEPRRVTRRAPKTLDGIVYPKFRPFLDQIHSAGEVYALKQARLFELCVLTQDDYFVKDLSLHKEANNWEFEWMLSSLKLPPPRPLQGRLTVVGERFGSSYYHWLFHAIGRLCYVKKKFPLDQISYFSISHFDQAYHRDSLRLIGIPREKILMTSESRHLAPDELVLANWTGRFDPNIAEFLRETYVPHGIQSPNQPKRIYISRSRAPSRRLENEAELLPVLETHGFTLVHCEDLSFAEQIGLFHGAEAVAGPHGAAMANLVFCRPGTRVIEILSPGWQNELYWQLSEAVGLDYYCHLAQETAYDPQKTPQQRNLFLPPEDLEKLFALAGITG